MSSVLRGRRWALAFAIAVMLVTSIPYLLGFTAQGDGWRFTGFVFAVEDGNSYIAKMLGGSAGAWLFRTPYTADPQRGVLAFLPYLLLGKLAAPTGLHEQLVAIFHIFRMAAGCLVLLATYDFLAFFLDDERLRRWGLVMAALGGGLGWVLLLIGRDMWMGSMPLEFYSPEAFGFLALYGIPHLAAARAAMLWGLLFYLRATMPGGQPGWHAVLKAGVCWLVAALFQPLTALVMGMVFGVHLLALGLSNLWKQRRMQGADWEGWRRAVRFVLLAFIFPAPFLVYNTLAFSLDPYLKTWTAQNLILSPSVTHYLLAYVLLLPFLPLGARNLLREKSWAGWMLIAWVLAFPLLAYAPVNLQRRLVEGVWLALVVISAYSVRSERQPGVSWRSYQLTSLLIFPSTIILLAIGFLASSRPSTPLFHPAQETAAYEYLAEIATPGSVVLASYPTGNALPAWAPVRVLIGHGPESAYLKNLQPRLQRLFRTETEDEERRAFLGEFRISYLYYGPAEMSLGGWDPDTAAYLENIYEQGPYTIYRVNE
jgi:hypothetical protein